MRALQQYEASRCSGCGGYLPETTDPEGSWSVSAPHRCLRCDALALKQADYKDHQRPQALTVWPVQKRG